MKSYQSIKAQIAKLEKQAEAMLANQQQGAIAQINKLMAEFGLSLSDFVPGAKAKKAATVATKAKPAKRGAPAKAGKAKVTVGAAKYRDPKTQKTWTGRGKPPNWIVGVKNRDAFLIDAPAAAAAPAAPKAVKSAKPAAKAAAKPAAKKAAKKAGKAAVKSTAKSAVKSAGKKAVKAATAAAGAQDAPMAAAA